VKNSILRLSFSLRKRPLTRKPCRASRRTYLFFTRSVENSTKCEVRTFQTSPDFAPYQVRIQPQSPQDFETKSTGEGGDLPHPQSAGASALSLCRLANSLTCCLLLLLTACAPPRSSRIVVGAKNFTEQVVLGELVAQEIEAVYAAEGQPNVKVDRRFYLAGSYICNQALVAGRIDAYVEYTGTALTAILKQPVDRNPEAALDTVRRLYASRYGITVLDPIGFENTFAMVIRGDDAERLHLSTLSQAAAYAPQWRLGVGYEFEQRPDGLPGLSSAYNLHFNGAPRTMDLGLLYRALNAHQVDMIAANSTDGPIQALGLVALQDDRHYFPPYDAVPLVRDDALRRWPQISTALHALAGKITADDMRSMNEAVDGQHRDPAEVVREFRMKKGL